MQGLFAADRLVDLEIRLCQPLILRSPRMIASTLFIEKIRFDARPANSAVMRMKLWPRMPLQLCMCRFRSKAALRDCPACYTGACFVSPGPEIIGKPSVFFGKQPLVFVMNFT